MSKICRCGYDINNSSIIHETDYSGWGWFLFTILGLSAKPKLVRFICSKCGEEIKRTNDPKILNNYVGR